MNTHKRKHKITQYSKANSYFDVGDLVRYLIPPIETTIPKLVAATAKLNAEIKKNNVGIIISKQRVCVDTRKENHQWVGMIEYRIKWLVKGTNLWVDESLWYEFEGSSTLEASLLRL